MAKVCHLTDTTWQTICIVSAYVKGTMLHKHIRKTPVARDFTSGPNTVGFEHYLMTETVEASKVLCFKRKKNQAYISLMYDKFHFSCVQDLLQYVLFSQGERGKYIRISHKCTQ
jgi:hypothetical protein